MILYRNKFIEPPSETKDILNFHGNKQFLSAVHPEFYINAINNIHSLSHLSSLRLSKLLGGVIWKVLKLPLPLLPLLKKVLKNTKMKKFEKL